RQQNSAQTGLRTWTTPHGTTGESRPTLPATTAFAPPGKCWLPHVLGGGQQPRYPQLERLGPVAGPLHAPIRMAREALGICAVHRRFSGPGPAAEPGTAVIVEGLAQFLFGVHHERAVLRDRLADRATLQHQ